MKMVHERLEVQSEGLHPTSLLPQCHRTGKSHRTEIRNPDRCMCCLFATYNRSSHDSGMLPSQDLLAWSTYSRISRNLMEKPVPTCRVENQYLHPGPKHIAFGDSVGEPGPWTSLNSDGHLRSCLFGRSETVVIENGEMDLGEFGYTYFIDWDRVRARKTHRVVVIENNSLWYRSICHLIVQCKSRFW